MYACATSKVLTLTLLLVQVAAVESSIGVKGQEVKSNAEKKSLGKTRSQLDSFLNEWAVHIPGGQRVADAVAAELGYENLGQVRWRQCGPSLAEFSITGTS